MRHCLCLLTLLVITAFVPVANAADSGEEVLALKLPRILSNKMVLQVDKPLALWGWAQPGATVVAQATLTTPEGKVISLPELTAVTEPDGTWRMKGTTPVTPAGASGEILVTAGEQRITIKDALVGEVWVGSGQSNMELPLSKSENGAEYIAKAANPRLRLYWVRKQASIDPSSDVSPQSGGWFEAKPDYTMGFFSAVAYHFGKHLSEELDVPVGLVHSSWGGTIMEGWTPPKYFESDPSLSYIVKKREELVSKNANTSWLPGTLYNGMIAPLQPLPIRGVIWYQGEGNTPDAYRYRTLFPTMIKGWRAAWNDDFPFVWVQLPNFGQRQPQPSESNWAELREAQLMTLSESNTAQAVTIDIGEAENIHPGNKHDVGKRLALAALKLTYGKDIVASGPALVEVTFQDGKAILTFDQKVVLKDSAESSFALAGEDHAFAWATATMNGKTVTLQAEGVNKPIAARYAWQSNPPAILFNAEGLPGTPFRTDDFPGETQR